MVYQILCIGLPQVKCWCGPDKSLEPTTTTLGALDKVLCRPYGGWSGSTLHLRKLPPPSPLSASVSLSLLSWSSRSLLSSSFQSLSSSSLRSFAFQILRMGRWRNCFPPTQAITRRWCRDCRWGRTRWPLLYILAFPGWIVSTKAWKINIGKKISLILLMRLSTNSSAQLQISDPRQIKVCVQFNSSIDLIRMKTRGGCFSLQETSPST